MAGIRHRIVHDYGDVDLDVVWRVVTHELPALINKVRAILPPDVRPDDPASAWTFARDMAFICRALVVSLINTSGPQAVAQAGHTTRP